MITNAILSFFGWVAHAVVGSLPTIAVPSWMSGNDSAFAGVFQLAGGLSVWFPVGLVLSVVLMVLACYAAGFAVKIARMILSLFTAGGGSAA